MKVKEHLHDLTQLDHSFDELGEAPHMFQPSLRAMAILNVPNLALHVVYRALRKDFSMLFREAFFELGQSLVKDRIRDNGCLRLLRAG